MCEKALREKETQSRTWRTKDNLKATRRGSRTDRRKMILQYMYDYASLFCCHLGRSAVPRQKASCNVTMDGCSRVDSSLACMGKQQDCRNDLSGLDRDSVSKILDGMTIVYGQW